MEYMSDKVWAIIAAVISALGGFVVYEHKRIDSRFNKLEQDVAEHKINVAVFKESLVNLKEDTQEIKEAQKDMIELLSRKRKI